MSLPDALGLGPEITYQGKVWRLAPMDELVVRGRYTNYLRQRAVGQVLQMRSDFDPATIEAMLATVTRDFASGVYDWGQPIVRDSLRLVENMERMLMYMLQRYHPEVDLSFAKKLLQEENDQILTAIEVYSERVKKKADAEGTTATA